MTDATTRLEGRRLVTYMYVAVVVIAGVFGAVIGMIRPEALDPDLFFLVQLPPTPLGMAVFGTVTVGVLLGGLLLLVNYVGERFDTGEPRTP